MTQAFEEFFEEQKFADRGSPEHRLAIWIWDEAITSAIETVIEDGGFDPSSDLCKSIEDLRPNPYIEV